jgi:transcriptional regulator with XRE-family HTH domain
MNEKLSTTFTGLTFGEIARLTRLKLKLRQIDVASRAYVTVQEVIRLEKDSYVLPKRRERILAILGLGKEDPDGNGHH